MKEVFNTWFKPLYHILSSKHFHSIIDMLKNEYRTKDVFPKQSDLFSNFKYCDYDNLKIVIINNDPTENFSNHIELAKQGVLFLNENLTVVKNGSHALLWKNFTKLVIDYLLENQMSGLIYMTNIKKYKNDISIFNWHYNLNNENLELVNSNLEMQYLTKIKWI